MNVPADPKGLPTGETALNQIEAACESIDTVELHTVHDPNDDMPNGFSERYTALEKTTMKALMDTQKDIEKTLAAKLNPSLRPSR